MMLAVSIGELGVALAALAAVLALALLAAAAADLSIQQPGDIRRQHASERPVHEEARACANRCPRVYN